MHALLCINLSCLPPFNLPVQITVATSMTLRVGSTAEQTFNAVERVQVSSRTCWHNRCVRLSFGMSVLTVFTALHKLFWLPSAASHMLTVQLTLPLGCIAGGVSAESADAHSQGVYACVNR
jgi:hypothetical protein